MGQVEIRQLANLVGRGIEEARGDGVARRHGAKLAHQGGDHRGHMGRQVVTILELRLELRLEDADGGLPVRRGVRGDELRRAAHRLGRER